MAIHLEIGVVFVAFLMHQSNHRGFYGVIRNKEKWVPVFTINQNQLNGKFPAPLAVLTAIHKNFM